MLAEELIDSPASLLAVEKIIEAVDLIDPNSPLVEPLRKQYQALGADTSRESSPGDIVAETDSNTKPSDRQPADTKPPDSSREYLETFDKNYKPEPAQGQNAEARHQSAWAHLLRGNFDDAEKAAREAIDLDGTVVDYPLTLADILVRKGQEDEALQLLQQISFDFSEESIAHEKLGDLYLAHEDYESARLAYLRALNSEPDTRWRIELGLSRALRRLGNRERAIELLRSAYDENPLEPATVLDLAYVLRDRKAGATEDEVMEAVAIIASALERRPDCADLLVCQAQLQVQTEQYEDAITSLEKASKLDTQHPIAGNFLTELKNWYDNLDKAT